MVDASITAGYIALIAGLAVVTGVESVLFPELGALSHDIVSRPQGTWARAPLMLVVTPVLAAVAGTLVTRNLDYSVLSVLLIVGLVLLLLKLLHSPIAPALSAGLLPLTLGAPSWWYPPSILVGTTLLALLSILRRRRIVTTPESPSVDDIAQDAVERSPRSLAWAPYFLTFVALVAVAASLSGQHFLLFPPLVVIAYEMFAHPDICPWAGRPMSLPLACVLTASVGLLLSLGNVPLPIAAVASLLFGIAVLRAMRLHVPPALAVSLLPFVMHGAGWSFPLVVGVGTSLLTLSFMTWRRFGHRVGI